MIWNILPQIDLMTIDCNPDLNLIFENLIPQSGVTYRWDFPDGSFSYHPDTSWYTSLQDTGTVILTAEIGTCQEVNSFRWSVNCNVLPITWTDYDVDYQNGQVDLRWRMTGDELIDKYHVEHKAGNDDWQVLHSVQYDDRLDENRYIHVSPSPALNYYRIKAIDVNGAVE